MSGFVLYFCTSKASKAGTVGADDALAGAVAVGDDLQLPLHVQLRGLHVGGGE